jgi:hypothetical protein
VVRSLTYASLQEATWERDRERDREREKERERERERLRWSAVKEEEGGG